MRSCWILVLLLAGCHSGERVQLPLRFESPAFKVITFNVNYAAVNPERSARVIEAARPDVVALQETTPDWERFLRRRLRRQFPRMRFWHRPGAGGMAFLSRYPLREIRRSGPPRGGWFPAWHMEVTLPKGRKVRLLNVHLRPPLSDSGRLSSIVSAYFSTRSIRLREVRRHLPRVLPKGGPLIVLGDFNESDHGRAHEWLKRLGLRSALGAFDRRSPTWRWHTSVGTFRSRLDHIYHTRGLRCLGAQVLGEAASDHYPVEAVFRIPRRRAGRN